MAPTDHTPEELAAADALARDLHVDDFGKEPARLGDDDFVAYLVDTLIPDLIASGHEATAEDFQRCVSMIEFRDKILTDVEEIVKKVHLDL